MPSHTPRKFDASDAMFDEIKTVLTICDLCSVLQIGKNTAYDLVNSGLIRCIRVKNRIRIPKQFLIEYIQQNSEQLNTGR